MGKIAAGMLVMLVGMLFYVPGAQAAGIPPTKACVETATKEFDRYVEAGGVFGTKSQMRKANDRLVDSLAKADCISDADSLRNWVAPKPKSEHCVAAVAAADAFFGPLSRKLRSMSTRHRARLDEVKAKRRKVQAKLRVLRNSGASRKRIRRVQNQAIRLMFKKIKADIEYFIGMSEAVEPRAVANSVTVFELISLRCIGGRTFATVMRDNEFVDEPAAKLLRRYKTLVDYSVQEAMFGFGSGSYVTGSSTRAKNAFEAIEEGDLAFDDQVSGGSGSYPLDSINFRNLDLLP